MSVTGFTQIAERISEGRTRSASNGAAGARSLERKRYLVELQGFHGLDDATVVALEPWLRLSPALCMLTVLAALLSGRHAILLALIPFAVGGVLLPNNPFDAIYNDGIRRWTRGPRIPRYGLPRRFACGVGSAWLVTMWSCFESGATPAGYGMGIGFMAIVSVQVFSGLCLPSRVLASVRRRLER
jgi:hypothetical protein